MDFIVKKDELGVISYYDQDILIMQDYNLDDENIRLYFEDNHIVKITNERVSLELDFKGRVLTADLINGLTCYFSYKHQKIAFFDYNGEYLGELAFSLELINEVNRLYIAKNLMHKLENFSCSLINNSYEKKLNALDEKITSINDLIVSDVVSILGQQNRRDCQKKLKVFNREELSKRRKLLMHFKDNKEVYKRKNQKLTRKYVQKRRQLKSEFNYEEQLREFNDKQADIKTNQQLLNELILEKNNLNNDYLARRKKFNF